MNFFETVLRRKNKQKESNIFQYISHSISLLGDRNENQDYFFQKAFTDYYLMVLADGMGGHSGGKYASQYFVESLVKRFKHNSNQIFKYPNKLINKLVVESRDEMIKKVNAIDQLLEPKTTFVATIFAEGKLITAHLGDSRCLVISQEKLLSITKDHSMAQLYADQGIIQEEDIKKHPAQSKLLKAISKNVDEDPDIKIIDLKPSTFPAYVIQMSDGFWQAVSVEELLDEIKIFENNLDKFEEIIDNLANKAVLLTSPDSDNTTIQVCRISI